MSHGTVFGSLFFALVCVCGGGGKHLLAELRKGPTAVNTTSVSHYTVCHGRCCVGSRKLKAFAAGTAEKILPGARGGAGVGHRQSARLGVSAVSGIEGRLLTWGGSSHVCCA